MFYEYEILLKSIKEIIKNRKITYKEIAAKMHLSEDAIKKNLSRNNISINKILSICKLLDLSLYDVLTYAHRRQEEYFEFSPHVNKYLSKNISYFYFFWELYVLKNSIGNIKRRYGLSSRSVDIYLKKLLNLKIIELDEKGKVNFLIKGRFYLTVGSELYKAVVLNQPSKLIQRIATKSVREGTKLTDSLLIKYNQTTASRETVKKFISDTHEVITNFLITSEQERNVLSSDKLESVSFVSGILTNQLVNLEIKDIA